MLNRKTCKVLTVLILLLFISPIVNGEASDPGNRFSENAQSSVTVAGEWVSEIPTGVIDGKNSTFFISKVPNSEMPIRLYRNGLLLVNDFDFHVVGQKLIITPWRIPNAGDVLQVLYVPSLIARSQPTAANTISPSSLVTGYANEIANAAVRAALQMEEHQPAKFSGSAIRKDLSSVSGLQSYSANEWPAPASFRMLGRQLAAPINDNRFPESTTAQGVDGLGDGLSTRALQEDMTESSESIATQQTDIDRANSNVANLPSGSFSSAIGMLERRLHSNTPSSSR